MELMVNESKENNKNYFDEMVKKIYSNGIQTSFEYEDYFGNLVYAIRNGWLDDYFYYAVALSTAEITDVKQSGIKDTLLSDNPRKGLKIIIAESVRQQLNGVDIVDYLDKMMKDIEEHTISLEQYYNYFENLELVNMADIDSIDCLDYAITLLNAKIESPKTYVETIKYSRYQKTLSKYIIELEQTKSQVDLSESLGRNSVENIIANPLQFPDSIHIPTAFEVPQTKPDISYLQPYLEEDIEDDIETYERIAYDNQPSQDPKLVRKTSHHRTKNGAGY